MAKYLFTLKFVIAKKIIYKTFPITKYISPNKDPRQCGKLEFLFVRRCG